MKTKLISILLFTILFLNFSSAVTIQENTQFQPTGTNTTFIFGNNLSFDLVEVHSTYLKLGNNTIYVNPSIGSVNITILNFTDSYKKFNETKSNSSATTSYRISNFTADVSVLVTKGSVAWTGLVSNSTDYINFDYSGTSASFEIELGTMPTTTSATTTSPSGGGYPTYKPTSEQLENGYEKTLRKNYKVQFEFNNQTHEIKLDDLINKTATITVSSEPQTFDLDINETKKLNLSPRDDSGEPNSDDFYDLEIFLKDIRGIYVDLIIKTIYEEMPAEEKIKQEKEKLENEEAEEKSKLWLWISVVVFVLIVGILIFKRKRRKS